MNEQKKGDLKKAPFSTYNTKEREVLFIFEVNRHLINEI